MQEPSLRPYIPYSGAASISGSLSLKVERTWTYPFSLYLAALLYMPIVCLCAITQIAFPSSIFNFSTENAALIALQVVIVIVAFFVIWSLFFVLLLVLRQGKSTSNVIIEQQDITRPPARIYSLVTLVLSLSAIMIDFFRVRHPYGIALIIASFFLFLGILYGPTIMHKINWTRRRPLIGTSFANFTRPLTEEDAKNSPVKTSSPIDL